MEEILSLIMVSFFALFPFLFLLASRKRMRERNRPGAETGAEPEPESGGERKNYDQPDSIVSRIMQTQGIRQIAGALKLVPEIAAEPVPADPKLPQREPERKPERQWEKKAAGKLILTTPEEPEPLRGRRRIETLPKLQQAVIWAEILGKPKGY